MMTRNRYRKAGIVIGAGLVAMFVACTEDPAEDATVEVDAATAKSAAVDLVPAESSEMQVGKRVFASCASCHTTNEGGISTIGPNLSAVLGSTAGSKQGYTYSAALKNSAIVWTEELLDRYIEDPASTIPGGTMAFFGVKDEAERKAVLAYLIAKTGGGDSDLSVPSDQGDDVATWE